MQDDLFDFISELDKPVIDNDAITRQVINRLMKTIQNPLAKDSDVNNTAKILLTYTNSLTEKTQININTDIPENLEDIRKERQEIEQRLNRNVD